MGGCGLGLLLGDGGGGGGGVQQRSRNAGCQLFTLRAAVDEARLRQTSSELRGCAKGRTTNPESRLYCGFRWTEHIGPGEHRTHGRHKRHSPSFALGRQLWTSPHFQAAAERLGMS